MSPPRCHSGSSDNGTPAFGNTSFSITPVHRHHIFKPRGAETEALLALWGNCWCPVVILVILSSRWMCCCCVVTFLPSYCTSCSLDEHYDGMFDCMLSIYLSNSVLSNISMLEAVLSLQSHLGSFLYIEEIQSLQLWILGRFCLIVFAAPWLGSTTAMLRDT